MQTKSHKFSPSWRSHFSATAALGLPLIGSHLAQILIHTTDIIMIGWYGVESLAGVVLAAQIFFVVFIVGTGFALAVMPLVANAVGAGDLTVVRRAVRMGLWLCLIYSLIMLLPFIFLKPILLALGQQPHLSDIAQDYMGIAMWGLFPAMAIMTLKSHLSVLEKANLVFLSILVAAFANVLFNWMFIFGNWGAPEMGVRGAAYASVLTVTFNFLLIAAFATWHPSQRSYQLFTRIWQPDWPAFWEVFRLGWPIGLTLLLESGLFAATTLMMGRLGTIPLAAHGIVLQVSALAFMIPLGLSNVATIRGGQAYGANDRDGLKRAGITVVFVTIVLGALSMAIMIGAPKPILQLFLDSTDPDYIAILIFGSGILVAAAAFQLADGLQVVSLGLLRGMKDTQVPMILAAVSYWIIGMPLAYILAFKMDFGGIGIWAGLAIGLWVAAITLFARYFQIYKRWTAANARRPTRL